MTDPVVTQTPTLRTRIAKEVGQTPLQVLFGGVSATVGLLALYVAWRTGGSGSAAPTYAVKSSDAVSGYLVSFAALIAISTTAALIGRLTRQASWISTYFASMLYACTADFLITLVIRTQGVRFGVHADQPAATSWLVYAALLIVFASVNGQELVKDVLEYEQRSSTREKGQGVTVGDVAFSVGFVTLIWAVFVRLGSNGLSGGLLQL